MSDYTAYGTARNALLEAQDAVEEATPEQDEAARAAMWAASQDLIVAEEPIRPQIEVAWDNNQAAVTAALQAVDTARQQLAAVEIQVSEAARARNPVAPLFNAEEFAQVQEAQSVLDAARQQLVDAQQAFKAGVTVEDLEAVT